MSRDVHDSPLLASAKIQGGFVSKPTSPTKPLPNTIQEQKVDEKMKVTARDVISSTNGFFAVYGTPPPVLVPPPDRTSNNIDFMNNIKNVTIPTLSSRSRSSSILNNRSANPHSFCPRFFNMVFLFLEIAYSILIRFDFCGLIP
jgi:hypothetical protein